MIYVYSAQHDKSRKILMPTAVTLTDVQIQRGQFRIGPLNFTINPSEKIALLGSNGCGKSSVLLAIANLLPIQSGNVTRPNAIRLSNGIFSPTPEWTVQETLRDAVGKNARAAMAHWRLEEVSRRRLASLSLGFQQRVSLACATFADADLILLDEPANGLDPMQWQQLNDWLNQEMLASAVVVSHQPERLPHSIQRALIIDETGLQFDGSLSALPAPWPSRVPS